MRVCVCVCVSGRVAARVEAPKEKGKPSEAFFALPLKVGHFFRPAAAQRHSV